MPKNEKKHRLRVNAPLRAPANPKNGTRLDMDVKVPAYVSERQRVKSAEGEVHDFDLYPAVMMKGEATAKGQKRKPCRGKLFYIRKEKGGKGKKEPRCSVELEFMEPAAGRPAGAYLRLCGAANKPGKLIPVSDANEAQAVLDNFCGCVKGGEAHKNCSTRAGGYNGPTYLGGWRRKSWRRRR